ncbi:MAG: hypothetical protein E7272_03915, partial [Pseudobutyrivibrio ruminis]|nr:hypothetical protein [Pseudobutyrivibrio ruminis]
PTEVVEEAKVDTSGDDDVIVDDVPEEETEETTEVSEPEEITGLVEETGDESANEEALVVEEDAEEQKVVKAIAEDDDLTVNVTVNLDGGTIGESADTSIAITASGKMGSGDTDVSYATELTEGLAGLVKSGYTMKGVYLSSDSDKNLIATEDQKEKFLASDESTSKDVALTVLWAPNKVNFTYVAGDGTGDMAAGEVTYEGTKKFPTCSFTAPSGKEFDKWEVDGVKYAAGDTIPEEWFTGTGASDAGINKTLTATWKAVELKVEFAGLTAEEDGKFYKDYVYNTDLEPAVKVSYGSTEYTKDVDYTVAYRKSGAAEDVTHIKEAGTYTVTVAPKAGGTMPEGTTAKTLELTIRPAKINTVSLDAESYKLYYYTKAEVEASTASPKPVRGVTAHEVKPTITFPGTAETLTPRGTTASADDDYTVEYANNDKVGEASVKLTLVNPNYVFVVGEGETATTADSITKEFSIDEGTETGYNVEPSENTKATISNTESKPGKAVKYGKICGKKVEEDIPAIALNTIQLKIAKTSEAYLPNGKMEDFLEPFKDTKGNADVIAEFDFDKELTAEGAKLTLTAKEDSNLYEGSYEYSYKFVDEECTEHTWVRKVIPATFEADGAWWYECSACGERATADDRDEIKKQLGLDELTVVSGTIAKLDATKISFWIHNNPDQLHNYSDGFNFNVENGQVNGTALKDFKVNDYGKTISLSNVKLGNIERTATKTNEDGEEVTVENFKVSLTNAAAGKDAKVKVVFADDYQNGDYAGATAEWTFKVVEAPELVAMPYIKTTRPEAGWSYGNKLELATATPGASIYYFFSTPASGENLAEDPADADALKDLIKNGKATKYESPIKLDRDAHAFVKETTAKFDTVKLNMIAVKGDGYSEFVKEPLSVINPTKDWGDVNKKAGIVDTALTDASKLPDGLWISDWMIGSLDDVYGKGLTYSGFAKTFKSHNNYDQVTGDIPTSDYRVFFKNKLLTYGADYTIKITNNVNVATSSSKLPTITITGKGEYAGGTIKTFTIKPEQITPLHIEDDPDTTEINEEETIYPPVYWDGKLTVTENGKIQKPKYTAYNYVSGRDVKLAENKDFTVDYSQVLASATPDGEEGYPITITGKGNYTGTMTKYLRVVPAGRSLEKAKLTIDTSNVKFDGTDQINNLITTVTLGDQELKRGTDYEVSVYQQDAWLRNSRNYNHYSQLYSNGKYTVKIEAADDSDFAGSISKTVNIKVKGTPAITTALLAPSATKVPSKATTATVGEYIDITATAGGKTLTEGDDYVVVFSNNKKVGTAKATVYGVGAYTGSKAFSYKIEATKITASMFAKSDAADEYDGSVKTPEVKMYVPSTDADTEDKLLEAKSATAGSTKVEGKNFIITYPKDMVNAGTKKITVKGTGAYTGTVTLKYEIKKAKTADALTTITSGLKLSTDTSDSAAPEQSYTNAGFTPEFNSFGAANSYSNYSKWVKDNFTITYKKPKTGFAAGNEITVTVKGKKNFTNDVVTGVYKVAQADISGFSATVPDIVEAAKFNKGPAVSIVNDANKKLAAGEKKDYVVSYLYNGNNGHAKYSTVDAKDAVVAGTEYIARFSGKNGYKGTKDVVFKAMGKKFDLKNAKVQILGTYIFDEKNPKVLLDKENIIVTLNGEKLADANYEIVEYTKNNTVGTATVKLHGLTNGKTIVGGYKTATFKIQKASMNYMVDFKADLDDKVTKTLTITGSTKTLSSNKKNVFTLPKSGFKATLKGADGKTVNYVLKAWVDKEAGKTYGPGDSFKDEYAPGQVKTLYAQFVPANADNKLTVKFMSNGTGTSKVESGKMTDQVIKPGASAKLKANAFKMDGYVFKGWTTAKNPALNAEVQYWPNANIYNGGEKAVTLELYPVFTENYYTVKYNYAGGSAPATLNETHYLFNTKEQTIAKNIPVREGYKFVGWKAGKLESTDDKGLKIPASTKGNLTLTAKWQPLQYKVDFYNGATKISNIALAGPYTVGKDAVLMPAAPAVDGKTFLGWARADKSVVAQFKEAKSYKTLVPTAAETPATGTATVKLYAVYSTTQHTITYDLNGADARFTSQGVRKYAKADTADLVDKLATASRPGFTFEGWALTAEATTALASAGLKDKDEDLTLYAVWKAAAEDTITLDANGGTISKATTFKVKLGESAEIPAVNGDETDAIKVTRANYVFQGWATAENPTKVAYGNGATFVNKTGGAQTLYAVWAPESFALHLDTDGGIISAGYVRHNTFNVETEEFVLPTTAWISKDNYTFEGWAVGTKNDKDEITYATTGNENVTITTGTSGEKYYKALWSADSYTVRIDLDGGSLEAADSTKWSDNVESYTVETKSDAAVKLPTPKKAAYTFAGWQQMKGSEKVGELAEEVTVDPSTAANVKYVARWIPNSYTITLDVNGGEISDKYVAYTTKDPSSDKTFDIKPSAGAISYIFGAPVETSITLPAGQQVTKEHATFAGWIPGTKGTDGKITYSGEAVASVVINDAANAKDLYFQAKWTDVGKADVTFNANFIASGKEAADTSKEEVFVGDALPANTWSREGYTFLGWNTDKDAKTASVKDKAASTYASATTLYAIWAENTVVVTLNGNGGTLSTEQTITIKYSDAATKENPITAVATRDGYDFAKWSTKRTGTDSDLAADAKIKNEGIFAVPKDKQVTKITLYATWTAKNLTAKLTLNGGTLDDSIVETTATAGKYVVAEDKATATTSFTADAALVLPTAITKNGYTFGGWYTDEECTAENKITKIAKGTTAATTTVYAKWTAVEYTITYTLGDEAVTNSNPEKYTVETDTIILADPVWTDHTFTGWTTAEVTTPTKALTIEKGSTGNKEFTANWTTP